MRRVLLGILAVVSASAIGRGDQIGKWQKAGEPAQVNVGCIQVWACGPATDVLHAPGKHLVTTGSEITIGVCSTGGGAIDSCTVCLASVPTKPCLWHMEDDVLVIERGEESLLPR